VVFLKAVLAEDLQLDGLRIVVDCAHGAAYKVAPAVFEELGAEVIAIGCRPDGTNINAGCGSLYPERMCETIRMYDAHLGIALDGDADRVIVADEKGNVVDGDQLMAMVALYMNKSGELANNTVVATVMSNLGLEIALRREGIGLIRTAVGDRHVVARMRADGYNLGGEQSGHLVFLDHTSTGDGVLAGLKILTVMLREGKPLSELANVMERVPQVLVNIRVKSKPPISELSDVSALIASVEEKLGDEGRVLVRYSGTEPKARVMVEGLDQAAIQQHADEIVAAIQTEIGA
jgi:phosphoglucosamine mutase